jgi:hypothetical protein
MRWPGLHQKLFIRRHTVFWGISARLSEQNHRKVSNGLSISYLFLNFDKKIAKLNIFSVLRHTRLRQDQIKVFLKIVARKSQKFQKVYFLVKICWLRTEVFWSSVYRLLIASCVL